MSSIGTFGSFTQARLGIYASQKGMSVTGNNIANINTPGYTRQRLEQKSYYAGGADRYYSNTDQRVGYGVLCTGVSQLRDPYLDIRFRTKTADVGSAGQKLDKLTELQSVLNEVGKGLNSEGKAGFGVLEAQLSEIGKQLQQMIDQTGDKGSDIQVRTAAETLVKQFRAYATQLEELRKNAEGEYQEDIKSVNDILLSIRSLNESIRSSEIHGDRALELRDERNMLIDRLSEYMKIDVQYTTEEVAGGISIEKLVIKLGNANPDTAVHSDETTLVDGIYAAQLSQKYPVMNPAFDKNAPVSATNMPYLDENDNPTSHYDEAKKVDDPHLRLTVTELQDKDGRIYYDVKKANRVEVDYANFNGGQTQSTTDPITGVITVHEYTMVNTFRPLKNNDKAQYGQFDYLKPKKSTDPDKPYLKADGTPTADMFEAALEGTNDEKEAMREVHFYEQTFTKTPSYAQALDDNDLHGSLQSLREYLTEEGEFTDRDVVANVDENALTKRGIRFYQKSLDLLAKEFATRFNEANNGWLKNEKGQYLNEKGEVVATNTYTPPILCDKDGNPDPNGKYYQLQTAGPNGEKAISIRDYEKIVNAVPPMKTDANGDLIACDKDGNPVNGGDHYLRSDGKVITKQDYDALKKAQKDAHDSLARGNATELKDLNSYTADQNLYLEAQGVKHMGMNLFSTRSDVDTADGITASNISISKSWSLGTGIVTSYVQPSQIGNIGSTDSSNLLHMLTLLTKQYDFDPSLIAPGADPTPMFKGTFQEMLTKTNATLGSDIQSTTTQLKSAEQIALDIDNQRMSVSSVDLNDEAMNLMQYSKSYNAACRLMTTLDSMLDKLINGTGMTT